MIPIGLRVDFQQVPDASNLGYDYLEMPLSRIAALSDAEFIELVNYLEGTKIHPDVLYDMVPAALRVNGPDVHAQRQHEYLQRAFARAKRLGTKVIAFDAPVSRAVPSGFDYSLARRQTGNFLRIVQGHAAQFGLKIAIQNYRHAECNLINTVAEASMMVALLNLVQIGVLADTVQMAYASEPLETVDRCGSDLFHVHTGSPLTRSLPRSGDREDYVKLFRILTWRGYNGGVSAVSSGEYTIEEAREALMILQGAREKALV